jgi:hypothetical protein
MQIFHTVKFVDGHMQDKKTIIEVAPVENSLYECLTVLTIGGFSPAIGQCHSDGHFLVLQAGPAGALGGLGGRLRPPI